MLEVNAERSASFGYRRHTSLLLMMAALLSLTSVHCNARSDDHLVPISQLKRTDAEFKKLDEVVEAESYAVSDVTKFVREFGRDAEPYLLKRYENETDPAYKGKILLCLSALEIPGLHEKAIAHFEECATGEMTRTVKNATTATMFALGVMGTEESLGFLRTLANRSYWNDKKVPTDESLIATYDMKRYFAGQAILSMSLSGNARAVKTLKSLRPEVERPLLRSVYSALEEVERIKNPAKRLEGPQGVP